MWIDSLNSKDIKLTTCGFIYPDGQFFGTNKYIRGEYTHEKILQHYGIKEEPGVIRYCLSFIMFESISRLSRKYHEYKNSFNEYNIDCITEQQSKILREWMSAQVGKIYCPSCFDKEYQIRYLETLDDKMLSNIIMAK